MTSSSFLPRATQRFKELLAVVCPASMQSGVLVALSGGPDSVALLLVASALHQETGLPVAAAHLNHQLRSEASDEDERFCQDLCRQLDIPFHRDSQDVRGLARLRGLGLEEAGRTARQRFLAKVLDQQPQLGCIAKGQHRNDQAETLIMRLFRGSGPDGMAGIRPISGHSIHPLLDFSRQEILDFLQDQGQRWRTDASNLEGDNLRARLRRELLPLARDIFGEGCDLTPARLAELWQGDLLQLEELTNQALALIALVGERGPALQIEPLLGLPRNQTLRVLRSWLIRDCGLDARCLEMIHLVNILDWLREGQSGTALDLPGGFRLKREFDLLRPGSAATQLAPAATAADFRVRVQRREPADDPVAMGFAEGVGPRNDDGNWNLTLPSHVLKGNLQVRNPVAGDRFQPFGLDGTRKLSDLFRDLRIPEAQRSQVLVLCDDLGILWVVGHARSERTRLLPTSSKMVTISVIKR